MPNPIASLLQALKPDRSSLGIEITDAKIKMTHIRLYRGKAPLIHNYLSEPLPAGTVEEGRIKEPLKVIQTLQTMMTRLDSVPKHIHTVLPSQLVMVRFLKLPDINERDLGKLVDFEVKHQIHLPFEQPYYDFVKLNGSNHTAGPKRSSAGKANKKKNAQELEAAMKQAASAKEDNFGLGGGKSLFDEPEADDQPTQQLQQCDVMLVAAPQELINEYSEVLQSANIKLSSMEIKAFSLLRLFHSGLPLQEMKGAFLLVDVNETACDLSIFQGDQLKITRSVPLNFASNAAVTPAVDTSMLSNLDTLFAEFADPDIDFRNNCSELAHELERLMNFYRYTLNNRNQEFDGLLLSGDVERLTDIRDSLAERLTVDVRLFHSDELYGLHGGIRQLDPYYAVPLGLALRGSEV
ncbi:pilus assembly protein PilM [Paenibacillus athensensis]|uniref:Pilus assembly protein PilM n=1 Tax=Paenibacillus athensensis TaxID=1967502 RepID=A0A4Y8Q6Z6_9BACL|nr:pilus assembly protein PilM [Paenibacillus athensensis]MCD1257455.1 pilus assembly protein PilM [Paenibacillus athensensis]